MRILIIEVGKLLCEKRRNCTLQFGGDISKLWHITCRNRWFEAGNTCVSCRVFFLIWQTFICVVSVLAFEWMISLFFFLLSNEWSV